MEESVIVFALKMFYCQVRKVAQQVMCWPHKHEDGSLDLQNPRKGQADMGDFLDLQHFVGRSRDL